MDGSSTNPASRRRTLLKVIGGTVLGSGLAAGSASTLSGTGTTEVSSALRIESVKIPNAPDTSVTQSDERAFQAAANLRQGDALRIEVTVVNDAGGPAVARADIQSPDGVVPHVSADDSEFDTPNKVTLIIQLQVENTLSPGYYTTHVGISPVSIESGEDEAKADVHFLLDNSLSVEKEIVQIKSGITGFFDAVEEESDGDIDLAASVSEFGGQKSEVGGDGGPDTRVVQSLTTKSKKVEDAIDKLGSLGSFDEDGYTALKRVLNGAAGIRPKASQIPILFSDELRPRNLDENEIRNLQTRVQEEAAGFIGIGSRVSFNNIIELDEFTNNVTSSSDIDGRFFESSKLETNLLAGEIAEIVRVAVEPNATVTPVGEGAFVIEF